MTNTTRPARKRAGDPGGKRDAAGQFTPKSALSEAALGAAARYPPLRKARLTMPEPDFARLRVLKDRLKELDRPTRKNELLRAGLNALALLSDEALLLAVEQLPPAKPPKAAKPAKRATRTNAPKQPAARRRPPARARKAGDPADD